MSFLAISNMSVAFIASLISKSDDLKMKALDPGVNTACKQKNIIRTALKCLFFETMMKLAVARAKRLTQKHSPKLYC